MPPKKTKASKKTATRQSDDHAEFIDAQYNPDAIYSLLQDLGKQIDAKCNHIQKDSDFMVTSMQEAFHLEMIKLPNQVKKMSLARFKEEFGDSLEAVTRGAMGGMKTQKENKQNQQNIPQSAIKSHPGRMSMVFQTPMVPGKKYTAQGTILRNPREGEQILSNNGSPLGVFSTVVKPKSNNSIVPATPGVFVPLETGDVIDLETVDVELLSNDVKQDALAKMQAMMANMQKLMSKIENSSS